MPGARNQIRIPGHNLVAVGIAHDEDDQPIEGQRTGVQTAGRGLCSCGARSRVLPTTRERCLWQRRHREQLAGVPWA